MPLTLSIPACESCQVQYQQSLFQQCSGLEHSCWRHLLYQWSAAPDGKVACRYQSSLRLFKKGVKYLHASVITCLPTTVGSKSTNTALGTCLPAPVSLKKVLNESSPPPIVLSDGIWPSGCMPCSKQYNSQHAFPIWTPAWPTWIEIHSRCIYKYKEY